MTIEIVMARGWRMWIDGKPTGPFEIGEDAVGGYSLTGTDPVTNIKFDPPDDTWTDRDRDGGVMAVVGMKEEGEEEPIARFFKSTKLEWGTVDDPEPVKVRTISGEEVELDEITTYVRLEEVKQWWQEKW